MSRNTVSIGVAFQDQYLKDGEMENYTITDATLEDPTINGATLDVNSITQGTSSAPEEKTAAGNFDALYGTTSATTGDTRLVYARLGFTSTGSGETLRAFSQVTGANGATGGTINGAHISLSINGSGTISGAGNALRATLGGTSTAPGGTIAAIQCDSDFASGGSWTGASFIRFTNSGTGTVTNLFEVPTAMVVSQVSADSTHTIRIKAANGTPYYVMCTSVAP